MILFPIKKGVVVQKFGANPDFYKQAFGVIGHQGADIVSFHGDKILAPEDGIISKVYDISHGSVTKGFGVHIISNKNTEWILWHCMSNIQVRVGDRVHQGDCVAYEGDSGQVYVNNVAVPDDQKGKEPFPGTHLHWGKRFLNQTDTPSLNACLADIDGKQYQDSEGKYYEIQNIDNGYRGCVDPMYGDVIYYEQWINQLVNEGLKAAVVGNSILPEVPESRKTTFGQTIISILKVVLSLLNKIKI